MPSSAGNEWANQNGRLQGKIAIVTGASSGIGRAISVRFAQEGAKVVVADLNEHSRAPAESSVSTAELIKSRGGVSIYCKLDVCDPSSVEAVVKLAVEEFGRLDIMVNNAGVAPEIEDPHPVWETTNKTWNLTMDVNINGVFYGVRAAAGQMVKQEPHPSGDRGWIVNLSSTYGQTAIAGSVSYAASKHSVLGLTKGAALDCAPYRVHVNSICPGYTQSSMTAPLFADGNPDYQKQIESVHPFRGLGRPDDIAKMAVVLASDDAGWCTGAAFPVDGGFLCQ